MAMTFPTPHDVRPALRTLTLQLTLGGSAGTQQAKQLQQRAEPLLPKLNVVPVTNLVFTHAPTPRAAGCGNADYCSKRGR